MNRPSIPYIPCTSSPSARRTDESPARFEAAAEPLRPEHARSRRGRSGPTAVQPPGRSSGNAVGLPLPIHSFLADVALDAGQPAACEGRAAQQPLEGGLVHLQPGDLAGLLTSLNPGDVLFIDEIHRLSPIVEEYLYSAMEDYKIDIVLDKGPSARSIQIELAPFTLIGATTRSGLLTSPLRARFGIQCHLEYYDAPVLAGIVKRSARILDVSIDDDAAHEVALRSRGTPRIANALLRRVRDFAMVKGEGHIDLEITQIGLAALNIDSRGLDQMDNKILGTIIEKFGGGPVGLNTIATAVGEDAGTIEEVYEPFLIKEGFLKRTPRGREATELAYRHMGFTPPGGSDTLLF